jgi:hypothetical protein
VRACETCGRDFEPVRATARFCQPACRQRAYVTRRRSAANAAAATHPLVLAAEKRLREAGRLDTVDGQLALILARKLCRADVAGAAAISRIFRETMARALAGAPAVPRPGHPEPEDVVAKARRKRAEALAANRGGGPAS